MKFAVIGSPVAHSKSPVMHAAAYRALGLDHTYEKLETSEAEVATRVAALREGTYDGLNVTVPHKTRVLSLVDDIDASARAVGAANTLVRREGRVVAFNTDAGALEEELRRLGGDRARDRSAVVIGTGGAARAAVFALRRLGVARIVVVGRSPEAFAGPDVVPQILGTGYMPPSDTVAIVQATSCGMQGAAPGSIVADAIDWSRVPADAVALDVVYAPRDTPFLVAARARGLACDDGLGMLARQGALAFELWLGTPAPFDAMRSAIS